MADTDKNTLVSRAFSHKETLSYVAMAASILGSAVLTFFAVWVVYIVWKGGWPIETAPQRISILSKALIISLGGSLIVLITLGFVISRRTIKIAKDGILMQSDGDDGSDGTKIEKTETTVAS